MRLPVLRPGAWCSRGGVTVNDVKVTDVYKTFTADDLDEDGALIIRKGKKVYHKVKCED